MAEVAPAVPAVAPVAPVAAVPARGRGRGRGKKGKAKGKFGKGKAKARGRAPAPVALGPDGLPLPKPEKVVKKSLRQQVEEDVGNRDIDDVIKEAKAKVAELEAAVLARQKEEMAYEATILEGKGKMDQASASVDLTIQKEKLAFEKLKAAKQEHVSAQQKTVEKRIALREEQKKIEVLSNEGAKSKQEADLIAAQQEAIAAKEAAKKAYQEAMHKAQQVKEEMKAKRGALAITDDPEAEARAKKQAEIDAKDEEQKKIAANMKKTAAHDLKAELRELEKQRIQREKERAKAYKEANAMGKKRRAIGDASPAKAAKVGENIQDVD